MNWSVLKRLCLNGPRENLTRLADWCKEAAARRLGAEEFPDHIPVSILPTS